MATVPKGEIIRPGGKGLVFSRSVSAYNRPSAEKVQRQLQWLRMMYYNMGPAEFSAYAPFWILRKDPEPGEREILPSDSKSWNRRLIPFYHSRIQRDLDKNIIEAGSKRNIMLKPRQAGYTTWSIIMRLLLPAILEPGTSSMLISQNAEYAAAHFDMLRRAWRYFAMVDPFNPGRNTVADDLHRHLLHVAYSNRRELVFDMIESRVRCGSAEVEEIGQGLTIQHLTCTEVSRWEGNPEETLANAKEAVTKDGTLDIECTPNGMGGYFYEEWQRATTRDPKVREFKPHFHTWWWHDEYRSTPPVSMTDLTQEERTLVGNFGLDGEQISWRRQKVENLRHNFFEKYPEDSVGCFLTSGNLFFEKDILRQRWMELAGYQPEERHTKLQVFKRPIKHRRYIIGVDVATGLPVTSEDPDYSAAVVIDMDTGEEVAAYRAHVLPEDLAWDMADLGHEYNDALLAVERNGEGGTVIMALTVACQYGNIYRHKDWWKRNWQNTKEIEGFITNKRTRPMALNRIGWFVSNCPHMIYDKIFIQEALSFIREEEKGTPQAQTGAHDDTVMCRAIAHYVRHVKLGYLDPSAIPRKERYGDLPTEFVQ